MSDASTITDPARPASPDPGPPEPARRGRRRIIVGAVAAVVVVGVAAVGVQQHNSTASAAKTPAAKTTTAKVTRTNIASTTKVSGTLEFEPTRPLVNQVAGTLTGLPRAGDVIDQGSEVYRVDGQPVIVLFGETPAYRTLDTSSTAGDDISQLQDDLIALGLGGNVTVNGIYDSATKKAVIAFQKSVGLTPADGTLTLGQVVFMPSSVRITSTDTDLGATVQVGAKVVTVTLTERVVTATGSTSDLSNAKVGSAVTIVLPNRSQTTGKIRTIGPASSSSSSSSSNSSGGDGGAGNNQNPNSSNESSGNLTAVIDFDNPDAATAWDQASVDVQITDQQANDVLVVPVTALLALAEGGYAVQVPDSAAANGYRLVAVTTGIQSGNNIEVTGELTEGTDVVVPSASA